MHPSPTSNSSPPTEFGGDVMTIVQASSLAALRSQSAEMTVYLL
jgi:hypothetical protein